MTDMQDLTLSLLQATFRERFESFQFSFFLQVIHYFQDLTCIDVQSQRAQKPFQDKTSLDDNTSSPSAMPLAEIKCLSQSQLFILYFKRLQPLRITAQCLSPQKHTLELRQDGITKLQGRKAVLCFGVKLLPGT